MHCIRCYISAAARSSPDLQQTQICSRCGSCLVKRSLVRTAGLEPARVAPAGFKPAASTDFATPASLRHRVF